MSEISSYVGAQVRRYRKACGMTIQQLADQIHKSRATVCKYENGEIVLDVETLYEISQVADGFSRKDTEAGDGKLVWEKPIF